jgi:hypothetical protein
VPFTRDIRVCQRPQFGGEACPTSKLVGANDSVETAVSIIRYELRHQTSCISQVPPLLCSRLAGGGKTTLLYLIFDALKQSDIFPIFITFDGSSTFQSRVGESQAQAILRMIALELIDTGDFDPRCLVCNEKALDEYLGSLPVVLIIDNLNALASPVDQEAARMLRMLFLDRQNRYLVFSSQTPINVDQKDSHFGSSTSIHPNARGCHVLGFSPCLDLTLLQNMSPSCSDLNPAEVSLYGGIPSLIYSVKNAHREITPSCERIQLKLQPRKLGSNASLLSSFVASLLDGVIRSTNMGSSPTPIRSSGLCALLSTS